MWARIASVLWLIALSLPAAAQENVPLQGAVGDTGILTIERDRLFTDSALGRKIVQELDEARTALRSENTRIETELSTEERALADQRSEMDAEEFRALATAFDEKVETIRAEQEEKLRALTRRRDQEQQDFYSTILPILAEVVRDRRGLVVFERRTVFLAADGIDITDEVILRIDANLPAVENDLEQPSDENQPDTGDGTVTDSKNADP